MAKYGKQQIFDLLAEKNIPYDKLEHEAVVTMEEMDAAGITARGGVCRNLFLRDMKGRSHFLVTVPEETDVDLRVLADKIGSTKLSFASAERLEKYLGVEQGSVSPLGVLNDETESVTVIFDKSLTGKVIGVHPNDNTATMWLKFEDIKNLIKNNCERIILVDF